MGRDLQKAKNRSSIPKARKKPKSKKHLLHNPIIAANWDKSQTLVQNYQRLGLTRRLNKSTGGVEKRVSDVVREREDGGKERHRDGLDLSSRGGTKKLEVGEARIERDKETGRIVRVLEQGGVEKANPLNDPLNSFDSDSESEKVDESFYQHGTNSLPSTSRDATASQPQPKTAVVAQLETEARRPEAKYRRKQSQGEKVFIESLMRKYGDDYGKMARDVEINYMQRSEGDLKRRVRKWREAGGGIAG